MHHFEIAQRILQIVQIDKSRNITATTVLTAVKRLTVQLQTRVHHASPQRPETVRMNYFLRLSGGK